MGVAMKKNIFSILLTSVSMLALAQENKNLSRTIEQDKTKLTIRVSGYKGSRNVDYDRTFEVGGMSKDERKAIVRRIIDSLGVDKEDFPVATAPLPVADTESSFSDEQTHHTVHRKDSRKYVGGRKPYSKEVKYDYDLGEMHMRYQFMRDGEEFVYEKTVNAVGVSNEQIERLIKEFEGEIKVPVGIAPVTL